MVQTARGPNGETIALTHDVCGRVVTRRVDRKGFRPKTWTYGWDALDRLVTCGTPEGDTWFYRYDPFGRRLTKVRKLREAELAWTAQKFGALVPEDAREKTKVWTWPEPPNGARADDRRPPVVGTHFTWDGDVVAEEAPLRLDGSVDWAGGTRWHFEPGGFRPLAKQTSNTLLHIVNDHFGTPKEMFDEGGNLRWATNLSTWGVVRGVQKPPEAANDDGQAIYPRGTRGNLALKAFAEEVACDCPIRFQGQWADEETGLYYNRSRYYDPIVCNYATRDPIGLAGGQRLFGYVDSPTTSVDGLGLSSSIANPVPDSLARVVPGDVPLQYPSLGRPATLGRPNASDVFVADPKSIAGLSADEITEKLTLPENTSGYRIMVFPRGKLSVATPIARSDPGFIGGGRTAGGAPEFVIPNGPLPPGTTIYEVPPGPPK